MLDTSGDCVNDHFFVVFVFHDESAAEISLGLLDVHIDLVSLFITDPDDHHF